MFQLDRDKTVRNYLKELEVLGISEEVIQVGNEKLYLNRN